jgi:uncharacterized protein (TIGR03905 family)
LEGVTITELEFEGGCPGNLKGLSALVKGMDIRKVVSLLEGISCGDNPTSCPDQLAKAIKSTMEEVK